MNKLDVKKEYAFLSNDVRLAMGVLYGEDGDVNIGIDADCSITKAPPEYLFTNDDLQIKAGEIGFFRCKKILSTIGIEASDLLINATPVDYDALSYDSNTIEDICNSIDIKGLEIGSCIIKKGEESLAILKFYNDKCDKYSLDRNNDANNVNIIIDNNDSIYAGCFDPIIKSLINFLSSNRIHPDPKIANKDQPEYKKYLFKAMMPYREFGSCEDLKIRKYPFNVFGANLIANSSWTQPSSENNINNTNTIYPIDIGAIEKKHQRNKKNMQQEIKEKAQKQYDSWIDNTYCSLKNKNTNTKIDFPLKDMVIKFSPKTGKTNFKKLCDEALGVKQTQSFTLRSLLSEVLPCYF